MGKLNETGFKNQIKEGNFSNVYLLCGSEDYLKDFYLNKLKKKVVAPDFADFNIKEYEGRDVTVDDVIIAAQTLPMMSEYSLVIVHDFPFIGAKEKLNPDFKKLEEYFKDIAEQCILVFWCESVVVDAKSVPAWNSVIKAFSSAGDIVEINERTPSELAGLLVNSASKRGCTLDKNTAFYLTESVGTNIQVLFNELEKLCAYAKGSAITRELIDKLAVKSLQAKVFDLSKFILSGDSDRAYKGLFVLFSQREEPGDILSVIASYYVDMYRVKCAKEAGKVPADVAEYYKYNKNRLWVLDKAAGDCAKISINNLRTAIDILSEADFKMKSTGIDGKIILEEAVAKLLQLRNRYE